MTDYAAGACYIIIDPVKTTNAIISGPSLERMAGEGLKNVMKPEGPRLFVFDSWRGRCWGFAQLMVAGWGDGGEGEV